MHSKCMEELQDLAYGHGGIVKGITLYGEIDRDIEFVSPLHVNTVPE